ncbi:MAG: dTDP-glucose 4,6-dehydratase [Cyanobacteria bacterium PR.3.49]|nr:dTDP-glucose 4,6-dehydratase [Cyanobacteria bacterium PR.3.49]
MSSQVNTPSQHPEARISIAASASQSLKVHHWCAITLSVWLVSTALTFYAGSLPMIISDSICGALILILAVYGLSKKNSRVDQFVQWSAAFISAWLMFAPLVFWTKSPVAYEMDNFAAVLLVAIYWIAPRFNDETIGAAQIPPGWDYNPSAWWQRVPLVALALVGYFIARYLACCQLGYTSPPWDPVFHDGTEKILNSEVSKAFLISDAGLGAVSYLIDTLAGVIGGKSRWQTMPWMVVLFGLLVVPPGVVSIVLIILQPVAVGSWCFLCLIAAVNMLLMVPLALDEVIATGQYLIRAKKAGHGYFRTMCLGTKEYMDTAENEPAEKKTQDAAPPIFLLISSLISASLLAAPHYLKITDAASVNCFIVGALLVTFSVMAFAEVCRSVRLLNIALCAWLIASLMFLPGYSQTSVFVLAAAAVAITLLCIPRGRIMHRYGTWTKFIQ